MDTRNGRFVTADSPSALRAEIERMADRYPASRDILADFDHNLGCFEIGERLVIKGSIFRIQTISRTGRMVLRLQPRSNG